MHLVAIAAAAGIAVDWDDFAELSSVTPLLARVYPNGLADVNHFHAAGGLGFMIRELLDAGLLHEDVNTILGHGLRRFCVEPAIEAETLVFRGAQEKSLDTGILRPVAEAFDSEGGLRVVDGNIGRAIIKTSAVAEERHSIEAPARVFLSQAEFTRAFEEGSLEMDFVAVLPAQGPSAVGMPELHKLTPYLGVLQGRGYKVALLTDGRMSGASGSVLAAIQVTPEAVKGGTIGKIRDGDIISIDAANGTLKVRAEDDPCEREAAEFDLGHSHVGMGRELFTAFRASVGNAEDGASIFLKAGR